MWHVGVLSRGTTFVVWFCMMFYGGLLREMLTERNVKYDAGEGAAKKCFAEGWIDGVSSFGRAVIRTKATCNNPQSPLLDVCQVGFLAKHRRLSTTTMMSGTPVTCVVSSRCPLACAPVMHSLSAVRLLMCPVLGVGLSV